MLSPFSIPITPQRWPRDALGDRDGCGFGGGDGGFVPGVLALLVFDGDRLDRVVVHAEFAAGGQDDKVLAGEDRLDRDVPPGESKEKVRPIRAT